MSTSTLRPVRSSYRHGDLHRALLEAGIALAREGGPQAVVLREATRRVGVVPNAEYRDFAGRQALLEALGRAQNVLHAAAELFLRAAGVGHHAVAVPEALEAVERAARGRRLVSGQGEERAGCRNGEFRQEATGRRDSD